MLLQARHCSCLARVILPALLVLLQGGCYYTQLAAGQLELNARRVPIEQLLAESDTPAVVRQRLEHAQAVRRFAVQVLGLPDNGSYTRYVELGRSHVVWNVFAAPEFSVDARRWCFPVVGCVTYRGYFAEAGARRQARRLERRGYDVHVAPVAAYSTLGRFEDPVLSSMLRYDEVTLAALLFHELAHQVVYVPGDTAFSESFATVVEIEGTRRWLESVGRADELDAFLATRARYQQAAGLAVAARQRLAGVYDSSLDPDAMRTAKLEVIASLREEYRRLRAGWSGGPYPDALLAGPINNARLAAIGTYHDCVPGLTARLVALDRDLDAFYAAARRWADAPAPERRREACAN